MQQSDNQITSPMHLMHQHRVQLSDLTNNLVSTSDRSKSDAVFLTLKQPPMHLMTLTSDAALTTLSTDNCQRTSDCFTVECSSFDITFNRQCI